MGKDYIFINPPGLENYKIIDNDECLGLGYINAALEKDFDGYILNCYSNRISVDELFMNKDYISDILSSLIIGISCNYYSTLPSTVRIVEKIREAGYKGFICLGGHQAVMSRNSLLKFLNINAICNGDGEISIKNLIQSIKMKTFKYNIKGFFYKKEEKIIKEYAELVLPILDDLLFPTRLGDKNHFLINTHINKELDTISISTSRGCPFRCIYCDIRTFYNKIRRQRSVDNVIEEIEYIYMKKKITNFIFTDDNFIGGSKNGIERAIEFTKKIKKRNLLIRFSMEMRVTDATYDLLSILKEAGLYHVNIGVESGSQSMLDRWNKDIKVEDSIKAIRLLESLNIKYNINFILVDAFTTYNELLENYEFLKKIRAVERSEQFFQLFINKMAVIDGTPLADKMKGQNILIPEKMRLATLKEQQIFDLYQPLYSYNYLDDSVACFMKNNTYWSNKVADIMNIIPHIMCSSQSIRMFCFRLFTMSIRAAENTKYIFDKIDFEIQQFCSIKKINY